MTDPKFKLYGYQHRGDIKIELFGCDDIEIAQNIATLVASHRAAKLWSPNKRPYDYFVLNGPDGNAIKIYNDKYPEGI